MPIKWDAQADAKLLVGIVTTSCQSVDYQAIAEFMGDGVTVNAVRLHIRTLKERAGVTESPNKGDKAANSPAEGSPKQRKRKDTAKKDKASKNDGISKKTNTAKKHKALKKTDSTIPTGEFESMPTDDVTEEQMEKIEEKTEVRIEAIDEAHV